PFELLQICVDNHCLFYDLDRYGKYPLFLWKLLSDNKTIVVGLGIEQVVKKLEKDYNMKISKWVDLRDKAREMATFGEIANNCSVEKLANKVLGEEWHVNKPSTMEWFNSQYDCLLSDEKVKFGSLEAFLAYRMAIHLLL
uniref:3-5 exonuclease n=1 Tax=Solanum tuberosum TaxID=4113 RepID=M1DYU2_SOLTU